MQDEEDRKRWQDFAAGLDLPPEGEPLPAPEPAPIVRVPAVKVLAEEPVVKAAVEEPAHVSEPVVEEPARVSAARGRGGSAGPWSAEASRRRRGGNPTTADRGAGRGGACRRGT